MSIDENKLFELLSYMIESYTPFEHTQRIRARELLAGLQDAAKVPDQPTIQEMVANNIKEKGYTGMCSAHRDGENPNCRICYPDQPVSGKGRGVPPKSRDNNATVNSESIAYEDTERAAERSHQPVGLSEKAAIDEMAKWLCKDHCAGAEKPCFLGECGHWKNDWKETASALFAIAKSTLEPKRESVAPDQWYCDIDPDERGDTPYEAMFPYRPRFEPTKIHGASYGPTKWGVMAPSLTEDGDEAHVFDTEEEAQRFCNEREALTEIEGGKP
jgi:hypothetical protein